MSISGITVSHQLWERYNSYCYERAFRSEVFIFCRSVMVTVRFRCATDTAVPAEVRRACTSTRAAKIIGGSRRQEHLYIIPYKFKIDQRETHIFGQLQGLTPSFFYIQWCRWIREMTKLYFKNPTYVLLTKNLHWDVETPHDSS